MALENLYSACAKGDVEKVQYLLQVPSIRSSQLSKRDAEKGWTPLIYAVLCGHAEVVRCLLLHGICPDDKSQAGEAPLHLAVEEGHRRIVQLLLEHYADPNVRNDYGETPLHAAVSRNDAGMVDLLLRFKADPHTQDSVVMFT